MTTGTLTVEISVGELIDKLTILEIKSQRIHDPEKLTNVRTEHDALNARYMAVVPKSAELTGLVDDLRDVNQKLWDIEDEIRDKERHGAFDQHFIEIARSVYRLNDRRAEVKRAINALTGSRLVEEKSYSEY